MQHETGRPRFLQIGWSYFMAIEMADGQCSHRVNYCLEPGKFPSLLLYTSPIQSGCRDEECGHGVQSSVFHLHPDIHRADPGVWSTGENLRAAAGHPCGGNFCHVCRLDRQAHTSCSPGMFACLPPWSHCSQQLGFYIIGSKLLAFGALS